MKRLNISGKTKENSCKDIKKEASHTADVNNVVTAVQTGKQSILANNLKLYIKI